MALYLGIDIGTSASKGVLIDDRCNMMLRQFGGAIFAACRASW